MPFPQHEYRLTLGVKDYKKELVERGDSMLRNVLKASVGQNNSTYSRTGLQSGEVPPVP